MDKCQSCGSFNTEFKSFNCHVSGLFCHDCGKQTVMEDYMNYVKKESEAESRSKKDSSSEAYFKGYREGLNQGWRAAKLNDYKKEE